eukprot:NODE_158_length_15065_cov_0.349125.p3 type:complete len:401 gc:universal NODE_158_length_15065_cov_0.349125:1314-112(-)
MSNQIESILSHNAVLNRCTRRNLANQKQRSILLEMLILFWNAFATLTPIQFKTNFIPVSENPVEYVDEFIANSNFIKSHQNVPFQYIVNAVVFGLNTLNSVEHKLKVDIREEMKNLLNFLDSFRFLKIAGELLKMHGFIYDCEVFEHYQDNFMDINVLGALKHGMTNNFYTCKNQFAYFFKNLIGENGSQYKEVDKAKELLFNIPMYEESSLFVTDNVLQPVYDVYKRHFTIDKCIKMLGKNKIYIYNVVKSYRGYNWIHACLFNNYNWKMTFGVKKIVMRYFERFVKYPNALQEAVKTSLKTHNFTHLYEVLMQPGFILKKEEDLMGLFDLKLSTAIQENNLQRIYWLIQIQQEAFPYFIWSDSNILVIWGKFKINLQAITQATQENMDMLYRYMIQQQ